MAEVFTKIVIDGGNYNSQQERKKLNLCKMQFEFHGQWWCWGENNPIQQDLEKV